MRSLYELAEVAKYNERTLISEYEKSFSNHKALIPLIWLLGAPIKAFTSFYPNLRIKGDEVEVNKLINNLQLVSGVDDESTMGCKKLLDILNKENTSRPLLIRKHSSFPSGNIKFIEFHLARNHLRKVKPFILLREDIRATCIIEVTLNSSEKQKDITHIPEVLASAWPKTLWNVFLSESYESGELEFFFNKNSDFINFNSAEIAIQTAWELMCKFSDYPQKHIDPLKGID